MNGAGNLGLALDVAGKSGLAEYVVNANDALSFCLVRSKEDTDLPETESDPQPPFQFSPEMTHQVYGEHENLFGYRGLEVDMWMSAATLKAYVKFDAEEVMKSRDGIKPDPVLEPLMKLMAEGQVAKNEEEFFKAVEKDDAKFKPMGEKLKEWKTEDGRTFETYHANVGLSGFRDYHSRLQPWIMFFIDAASYIDIDDDHWQFFLLFERYQSKDGQTRYGIVGYITVYEYYAYPKNKRPRVSQMLVLPPFQGQGHGAKLLDVVNDHYRGRDDVVDITVEDPSDAFIRLRDFVDARNCIDLPAFTKDKLRAGYSDAMAKECKDKFKICKRQARKVYEILRLRVTNRENDAEYKAYRVAVKKRLNSPYQKQENQLAKLKKVLSGEEYAAATLNITNRDQRLESLAAQYTELEEHYDAVIERLNKA